jgi:hypothetical protein
MIVCGAEARPRVHDLSRRTPAGTVAAVLLVACIVYTVGAVGRAAAALTEGTALADSAGPLEKGNEQQPAQQAAAGRWTELKGPWQVGWHGLEMVLDARNTLWVSDWNDLYYWDGRQFIAVPEVGGRDILEGGRDRGACLFVEDYSGGAPTVHVYRLLGAKIERLSDFTGVKGTSNQGPFMRPYVSRSGRIFILGEKTLATLNGDRWETLETNFSVQFGYPAILDNGKCTRFYFDSKLYSCDGDGHLTETTLAVPLAKEASNEYSIIHGPLGADKLVIIEHRGEGGYCVFNVDDPAPVATRPLPEKYAYRQVHSLFPGLNGSLWALMRGKDWRTYELLLIKPDLTVTPMPGAESLRPEDGYGPQPPGAALQTADGALWLGGPSGQIARYKDGVVRRFDWHDGFTGGDVKRMEEDSRGRLYVETEKAILLFDPASSPSSPLIGADEWSVPAAHDIQDDGQGRIWCFLNDHPREASRWDGRSWQHVKVPFNTASGTNYADSRGHLLHELFDVSPEKVTAYDSVAALLDAAAKDGARYALRFHGFYAIFAPNGCIYADEYRFGGACLFDGKAWIEPTKARRWAAYESAKYGLLLRLEQTNGKEGFYAWVNNRLVETTPLPDDGGEWMFGPRGVQPYEAAMVEREPTRYFALERRGFFARPAARPGAMPESESTRREGLLNVYHDNWPTAGASGGYWLPSDPGDPVRRVLGRKVIDADLTGTPLDGLMVGRVLEDAGHNLWFETGDSGTFWMHRARSLTVKPFDPPQQISGPAVIACGIEAPEHARDRLRLFWRVKGGRWQGGNPGSKVTLDLPTAGKYEIEIIAMDSMGATSVEPAVLNVTSLGRKAPEDAEERVKAEPWVICDTGRTRR